MSHYYLVASLPALTLGDDPPITTEAFRFQCTGVLSEAELRVLDAVLAGAEGESTAEQAGYWHDCETQLRNALARSRAAAYNVEARKYMRQHGQFSSTVEKLAEDVLTHKDPIERERTLDRGRMDLADEWASGKPFSFESVLAFAVKLRIVERWAELSKSAGRQALESFIDSQTGEPPAAESEADASAA